MRCPYCGSAMNKGGWEKRYPDDPTKPITSAVIWRCAPCWERGHAIIIPEPVKVGPWPQPLK